MLCEIPQGSDVLYGISTFYGKNAKIFQAVGEGPEFISCILPLGELSCINPPYDWHPMGYHSVPLGFVPKWWENTKIQWQF